MPDPSIKPLILHAFATLRHLAHALAPSRYLAGHVAPLRQVFLCGGILLFCVDQVRAESKAVLNKLVKKGLLTQQEADEIIREEAAEAAEKKSLVTATTKEPDTTKLTISGKVQTQFKYVSTTDRTTEDETIRQGFELRRMDITVDGRIGKQFHAVVDYRAETNAPTFSSSLQADAGFQVDKAYIEYDTLGYGLFLFGMKKAVFGYEEYQSSSNILTVERGIVNNYFAGNGASPFNMGLAERRMGLYYDTADTAQVQKDGGFKMGAAMTNDVRRRFDASSGSYSYYLNALQVWKFSANHYLDVGLNTTYTDTEANRKLHTPGHNDSFGIEPFARVRHGDFTLLLDGFAGRVQDGRNKGTGAEPAMPWGVNIMASYLISGTFEPVLTFDYLDTDGRGVAAGDVIRNAQTYTPADRAVQIYTGANWYLTKSKSVKFSAGVELARFQGGTQGVAAPVKSDVVGGRVQVQALF